MKSGGTVARSRRRGLRGPVRRASVRVVARDVPDAFADLVAAARVDALTLVTPWLTDEAGGCEAFGRMLAWAVTCNANIRLITREPQEANGPHRRAIRAVLAAGGKVTVNPDVHAKIFIAQFRNGSRSAVVGSANFTAGSYDLLETALVVSSPPMRSGADVIDDLLSGPVLRFQRDAGSRDIRHI